MSHDWKRKKTTFRIRRNSILGIGVFSGIALVVTIVILNKGENVTTQLSQSSAKAVRVIDGDTIDIDSNRFRLFGIDAPEKGQPCSRNNVPYDCGSASKEHMKFIISGAIIECGERGKDRWGRYIGICTADGEDISRLMVRHGWALAYRQYSSDYVSDEEFAQSNKLGMWAKEFTTPSEWRKSNKGDKL